MNVAMRSTVRTVFLLKPFIVSSRNIKEATKCGRFDNRIGRGYVTSLSSALRYELSRWSCTIESPQ